MKNYQIETEDEYREALNRFMEIYDSSKSDEELQEMLLLMNLMEKYERENCSDS
jgi:hypothetical protein